MEVVTGIGRDRVFMECGHPFANAALYESLSNAMPYCCLNVRADTSGNEWLS